MVINLVLLTKTRFIFTIILLLTWNTIDLILMAQRNQVIESLVLMFSHIQLTKYQVWKSYFSSKFNLFLAGDDNECVLPDADERLEITKASRKITFSYSVNWEASDIRWASRWDSYLGMGDVQIHWFSIVNSIVVVLFLRHILKFFYGVCEKHLSMSSI